MERSSLYSIGHSVRAFEEFMPILKSYGVSALVDVRSIPYSKVVPWFDSEVLSKSLRRWGIRYVFMGDLLGGRWEEDEYLSENGTVNYALVMKDSRFLKGINRLLNGMNKGYKICVMCSEKDPRKCHRSMLIGKYLLSNCDVDIKHIIDESWIVLQSEIEKELLWEMTRNEYDLFMSEKDILERAYLMKSKKIAYKKKKRDDENIYHRIYPKIS